MAVVDNGNGKMILALVKYDFASDSTDLTISLKYKQLPISDKKKSEQAPIFDIKSKQSQISGEKSEQSPIFDKKSEQLLIFYEKS